MPNFTAGTSFTDGVTNDVTALKLNALVADAVPTSSLALTSTSGTISNFTSSTANITLGTIPTLTAGTTTGTAGIFTSGTITTALIPTGTFGTTTSTAATITNGTLTTALIPTLTAGTTTGTAGIFTSGTVATLNSTTGTIANLSATTSTFLGTITGSTNVINIGSGQIYKDASGNVGVGTASPTAKLHISNTDFYTGKLTFGGVAATGTVLNNQATDNVYSEYLLGTWNLTRAKIRSEAGTGGGDGVGGGVLTLWTGNSSGVQTERLRIDASGDVYVAAGKQIQITGSPGTTGLQLFGQDAAESLIGTMSSQSLVLRTNATERLRIDASGGVTIAGLAGAGSRAVNASAAGLLSAASDASLKEEVVGAHIAGLSEILQIHPKMYRWKDDIANRGENASVELGFIANDVAPIIPSAAPLGNNGLYGFYDRSITAALVKAVQELKSENDSLKSRIEALEAK